MNYGRACSLPTVSEWMIVGCTSQFHPSAAAQRAASPFAMSSRHQWSVPLVAQHELLTCVCSCVCVHVLCSGAVCCVSLLPLCVVHASIWNVCACLCSCWLPQSTVRRLQPTGKRPFICWRQPDIPFWIGLLLYTHLDRPTVIYTFR
jgi:hypothetical protein